MICHSSGPQRYLCVWTSNHAIAYSSIDSELKHNLLFLVFLGLLLLTSTEYTYFIVNLIWHARIDHQQAVSVAPVVLSGPELYKHGPLLANPGLDPIGWVDGSRECTIVWVFFFFAFFTYYLRSKVILCAYTYLCVVRGYPLSIEPVGADLLLFVLSFSSRLLFFDLSTVLTLVQTHVVQHDLTRNPGSGEPLITTTYTEYGEHTLMSTIN